MDISPSAAIFLTLLAGLSAAAYIYTPEQKKKKEGFAIKINRPEQPPPTFVTGAEKAVEPREDSLLPGAPFGEIANSTPLPYKNPVLERATLFQINGLLEDLRAFLGFEAKQLEDRSDPNIQLPLTKAKGDFQRLQDEYYVLTSNPGVQSQLNQKDINEIRANMRYLQREARTLKASGVIPVGESGTSGLNGSSFLGNAEGFENTHANTHANTHTNQQPEKPATRADLNELIIKIYAEMQRLSASGTSDPVTQARVTALTNMRNDVQGILDKLDKGELSPKDVPIYKSDIGKVLPLLSNVNDPLPTVIRKAGLSPILANLLPVKAGSKESDYLNQNKEAINSAIEKLAKGLSWKVELEYTSDNKAMVMGSHKKPHNRNKTLHDTGFPSNFELETTANPMETGFNPSNNTQYGSHTYPISQDQQLAQAVANSTPSTPAQFDWKGRAQQIRQAIQARGLDPEDFGCLTPAQESSVAPEFSWRGYSKMICNRLTTTMDPGLPETCGCPPQGWLGWSS